VKYATAFGLERDDDRVRLITRGGYNWAHRYPWIVDAPRKIRQKHFVLDGEAVVLASPTSTGCTLARAKNDFTQLGRRWIIFVITALTAHGSQQCPRFSASRQPRIPRL
jgi:hypothetical protein